MRVIIDTDPGIDDAHAIVFALKCGTFEIEAMTITAGNCTVRDASRNALHLLARAGRLDIPVYEGEVDAIDEAARAGRGRTAHGDHGFGSITLDEPTAEERVAAASAADEIARRVDESPGEITILGLAPLTNIARAMAINPDLTEQVKGIIFMGGIILGPGNVGPFATANVLNDLEAAATVYERACGKLTMVGQDVTRHVRILDDRYKRIGRSGDDGKFLYQLSSFYRNFYRGSEPHLGGFPVHDLLVMVYALRPDLFWTEKLGVRIERIGEHTKGMTVADLRARSQWPRDVTVCRGAEGHAILDCYEKALAGSGSR